MWISTLQTLTDFFQMHFRWTQTRNNIRFLLRVNVFVAKNSKFPLNHKSQLQLNTLYYLLQLRFHHLVQVRSGCFVDSDWIVLWKQHRLPRGDGITAGCKWLLLLLTSLLLSRFYMCSYKWRCLQRGESSSSTTRDGEWCHFIDWPPSARPTARSGPWTKTRLA